jgi:hypothetical protein
LVQSWSDEYLSVEGRGEANKRLDIVLPIPDHPGFSVPDGLRVLDRLVTDEVAVLEGGVARLPVEAIYELEAFERRALGLQEEPTPIRVALRTRGYIGPGRGFSVSATLTLPDGSLVPATARTGAVVPLPDGPVLLDYPTLRLLRRLRAGHGPALADQHLFAAEVIRLAKEAGPELDGYLESQEYLVPEAVGVEADVQAPDHIVLRPVAEGLEDEFPELGDAPGPARSSYTRRDGTRRTRLVLGPEHREAVDQVRERAEIRGPDVARFFENPEAFLPDAIDVSRFSPRVKGLVPLRYRSQPYLDVREGKSARDWFTVSPRVELLADNAEGEPFGAGAGATPEPGTLDGTTPEIGSQPTEAPPHIAPDEYADLCRQVVETGEPYVLHGGNWMHIEPERAQVFLDAMDQAEVTADGAWKLPAEAAGMVLDVISNMEQLEFSLGESRPTTDRLPDYDAPDGFTATLFPHQEIGYRWLRYLDDHALGGLLADDMGLGKTVQVSALLAHLAERDELRPSLLVLPKSLIPNWKREMRKFCPNVRLVLEHHGSERRRDPAYLAQWDVVLTTYGTLRRDQLTLGAVDWRIVACDEAQNVKNPTTQVTSAVKGMKARMRLALTGTPVENGLSELWSIVDFVQPGKLGSRQEFRDAFERPMTEGSAESPFDVAHRLQSQLDPHYIRRTKRDILTDLPPKSAERYEVPLGPRQERLYSRIVRAIREGDMIPLEGLGKLIAVCSHPELLQGSGGSVEGLIDECPKLQTTVEILDRIRRDGERVVVFSRLRAMQDILQRVMVERFGVMPAIINGTSSGEARQRRVDQFNRNRDFAALILSPEAAGVGLNITGANHVIHYTRLWNPAKENQATDRVHRLGQTRPVTVHYPIVMGDEHSSVEEHLDRLLAEKSALAENVLWPRESLSVAADLQRILEKGE